MYEDKYIHAKVTPFIEWFNLKYQEDIGKIKTYYQVKNENREKHYSNAFNSINL